MKLESDGFIIKNYGQEEELLTKSKNAIDSSVEVNNAKCSNGSVPFSRKRRCYCDNN